MKNSRLRPYWLTLILGAGVLVLSLLMVAEWLYLRHQRQQSVATASTGPAPPPESELVPDRFSLPPLSQYPQTVERPLFMETRRPNPPVSATATPKLEAAPPVNFKLMGVLATPEGKMVLIADAKGKYRRLKTKDAYEGWEIADIQSDRVVLEQAGFTEDLKLLKKGPKPPLKPGQPPAQSPQAPSASTPQAVQPARPQHPIAAGQAPAHPAVEEEQDVDMPEPEETDPSMDSSGSDTMDGSE